MGLCLRSSPLHHQLIRPYLPTRIRALTDLEDGDNISFGNVINHLPECAVYLPLQMEGKETSEILARTYKTTRCNNPVDQNCIWMNKVPEGCRIRRSAIGHRPETVSSTADWLTGYYKILWESYIDPPTDHIQNFLVIVCFIIIYMVTKSMSRKSLNFHSHKIWYNFLLLPQ
jgi:hypothetical protein